MDGLGMFNGLCTQRRCHTFLILFVYHITQDYGHVNTASLASSALGAEATRAETTRTAINANEKLYTGPVHTCCHSTNDIEIVCYHPMLN